MIAEFNENHSWIPPELACRENDGIFLVEMPSSDPDLVQLIAEEKLEIDVKLDHKINQMLAILDSDRQLKAKLVAGLYRRWKKQSRKKDRNQQVTETVYLVAAFALPDENRLLIAASVEKPKSGLLRACQSLQKAAIEKYERYKQEVTNFEEEEKEQRRKEEVLSANYPDYKAPLVLSPYSPPKVNAKDLRPLFPSAICFLLGRMTSHERITQQAIKLAAKSGWRPPREGIYSGLCGIDENQQKTCLVTWSPYNGLPAYPEIRWAVQRGLRKAMANPRSVDSAAPLNDHLEPRRIIGNWEDIYTAGDAFKDIQVNDMDYEERLSSVKDDLEKNGFEAIAWYQPFHIWDEGSWGFYFDAKKLDELALVLLDEFRNQRVAYLDYGVCCQLAMGLVFTHEFFHARVESCLSWMELNVSSARFLRYKRNVYDRLKGTDDWVEEALANWVSWDWSQRFARENLSLNEKQAKAFNKVIEDILDLGPAGYNNWRIGESKGTWRLIASQMAKGKHELSVRNMPPLEGILTDQQPYDLRASDIPSFFIGEGVILNRLESLPNVINIPSRKELMGALKLFEYTRKKSEGKGSHEKWVGPDNRAFPLPKKDPVSRRVFQTFLDHFSIDKREYAQNIRPKL
jgi:hypothetical protein